MMAATRRVTQKLVPTPGYYGWTVVAIAMACSALSAPGQSYLLSLYLDRLVIDLGLSRVQLSSLYSVATLAAAAALPFAGRLADRVSSRRFLGGVLMLLAVSFLYMATVRTAIALGAALFMLRYLGQGALSLGTLTTTVRWFREYRGRALAFVSLGYAVGEIFFPALILALIRTFGWRGSWVALAGMYGLVLSPGAFWMLRERDPLREPVDGIPKQDESREGGHQDADALDGTGERSVGLREAMRLPVFWGVILCVAIPPLIATGVIFHQVGLFASRGWATELVAPAFACYAVGGIVATYTTGLMLERVPSRYAVATALLLLVVALGTPWLPVGSVTGALIYGGLLGMAGGTVAIANAVIWPDYFGIASLGSIRGVVNAVRNGSTAIGPPLVAALVTPAGSYAPAVVVLGGLALAGALGALACRRPAEAVYEGTSKVTSCAA